MKIGLLAGEASGDNLGASLIRELKRIDADIEFLGVGGPNMVAAGLELLHPMDELSVNGFVDPIRRLPQFVGLLRRLRSQLLAAQVDAFVGVDFNVFNLLLERALKKRGVPTAHYVSPSVYAWRRGRAGRLSRSADVLLTLYPFEPAFYEGLPVHAAYVGHPLAHAISDLHASDDARDAARAELGLDGGTVIALLPGSRASEVSLVGPSLFGAAEILTRDADVHVVVPCLRAALRAPIEALARQLPAGQVHIDDGDARRALTACDAALVKSGTSTLEAMCLARPMVVSYRLGDWSYRLARRLVRTPFIALPNILAGEALVPELLQHDATPAALAEALQAVLHRARADDTYLDTFRALHAQLRVGEREGSEAARVVHRLACSRRGRV